MSSRRRSSPSAELSWRQDQALGSTMRIVRQLGPTAFVLQEAEPCVEEYRVSLGNPHSCSCSVFMKQKEVCKHICWLLLKKFKLPRTHEYALKLGLAEREINQLLQGLQVAPQPKIAAQSTGELKKTDDGYIKQKEIDDEDICPICQELLLRKMLPVTYCRFGCGNSIHITCMKIWADHQTDLEKDSLLKCPLCVQYFAPLNLILKEFINSKRLMTVAEKQRLDRHLGLPCNNCRVFPIEGNCYKCIDCIEYHLCHGCFRRFCHSSHSFLFREKRNQIWRPVEPVIPLSCVEENTHSIHPEENSKGNEKQVSCVPEHIIKLLHTVVVRKCSSLLDPGLQCRLCLKIFGLGQFVRFLPCNHKFHRKCIDHWLQKENSCPIDGYVVYNPLTWENVTSHGKDNLVMSQEKNKPAEHNEQDLFVPGTALLVTQMKPGLIPEKCESSLQRCADKKTASRCEHNSTFNDFASSCLRNSASSLQSTAKVLKFSRYVKQLDRIAKH